MSLRELVEVPSYGELSRVLALLAPRCVKVPCILGCTYKLTFMDGEDHVVYKVKPAPSK